MPELSSGKKPGDTEVKQLAQEVEKYTLASHLVWALWGLISVIFTNLVLSFSSIHEVEQLTIPAFSLFVFFGLRSQEHVNDIDFDYVEYARQRFRAYWAKKSEVLKA